MGNIGDMGILGISLGLLNILPLNAKTFTSYIAKKECVQTNRSVDAI